MPLSIEIAQYLPHSLMVAGLSILAVLLFLNARSRMARRNSPTSPRDFIEEVRSEALSRSEGAQETAYSGQSSAALNRQEERLVQIESLLRRLCTQMDNKAVILEQLLSQTDERLRLLRDLLDQAPEASISPSRVTQNQADERAHASAPTSEFDGMTSADQPASEITPQIMLNRDAIANSARTHTPETALLSAEGQRVGETAMADSAPVDPLSANVYELADRGRSSVEIAQYLDEQVGKVELILALRGTARSAG